MADEKHVYVYQVIIIAESREHLLNMAPSDNVIKCPECVGTMCAVPVSKPPVQ